MEVKAYDREKIKEIRDEVLKEFKEEHKMIKDKILISMLNIEDALILEFFIKKLFSK